MWVTTRLTSENSFIAIADPDNEFSGKATLKVVNSMQDAQLNGTYTLFKDSKHFNLQLSTGFLWWNFNEKLTFNTSSPYITTPVDTYKSQDKFQTDNNFYGGQIGIKTECHWKRLSAQVKGQLGIGGMQSNLKIKGELLTNDYNGYLSPETFPGGYVALPTNIGHFNHTRFSIIPQINAQIACRLAKWVSINAGYTFLYATNVMFASNQLDKNINPSQAVTLSEDPAKLHGKALPQPLLQTSEFWVQGINVGIEFQF